MITIIPAITIWFWVNMGISLLGITTTGWLIYKLVRAIKDETYEI